MQYPFFQIAHVPQGLPSGVQSRAFPHSSKVAPYAFIFIDNLISAPQKVQIILILNSASLYQVLPSVLFAGMPILLSDIAILLTILLHDPGTVLFPLSGPILHALCTFTLPISTLL